VSSRMAQSFRYLNDKLREDLKADPFKRLETSKNWLNLVPNRRLLGWG
jgi:hypothetical protein